MSDKECIYREDAIKQLIIVSPISTGEFGSTQSSVMSLSDAIKTIKLLPAAPVREVVTCGECVHLGIKDFATGYCKGGPMCGVVKPWDYCSHGVRKADMRAEEGGPT